MYKSLVLPILVLVAGSCSVGKEGTERRPSSVFSAAVHPMTTISILGSDTLSDSARVHRLQPEPDGRSIAFLFGDPAKGITKGLGIIQSSAPYQAQLIWPDSVDAFWWSDTHQLSFTAGTGQGVRVVVDAHAAQLQAVDVASAADQTSSRPSTIATRTSDAPRTSALARAGVFIDSLRVQPQGTPQNSALRYRPDTALVGPGDTLAAVYVSAGTAEGERVNPAWYLIHLPTGNVQPVDSLTGRSSGLAASAGGWGSTGVFYYVKERAIWQVQPSVK